MAVTNSGMTLYQNNNAQASWVGSDDYDAEVSKDGGGSESWLVGKNNNETATLTQSANMGTAKYFNFWMKSDWGAFYTQIDTTLSDGTNATLFTVATGGKHTTPNLNPEISGDFKPVVLQINQGSNASYNQANHASVAINVDASSTGNIRAIVNHWIDTMWYGNARTIGGTTTSNALFSESHNLDTSNSNYDGCSVLTDAGLAYYTDIIVATTTGNSYGEKITWYGKDTTDKAFTLSITGSAVFNGTSIIGNGCTVTLNTLTATSFSMSGGGVSGGGDILLASGQTISGTVFDSCRGIVPDGATISNTTISNTTETTTGALELKASTDLDNLSNLTFTNFSGKYALYIPASVTGTISLNNFKTDGSGTDVYWGGTGGTLTINKSNGTDFTTSASAGGTVNIVTSVSIAVKVVDKDGANLSGMLVYIDEDLGSAGDIINTTTDINGEVSTSYSGVATSAVIRIRKYGYYPEVRTISLLSDSTTNIIMRVHPQQT